MARLGKMRHRVEIQTETLVADGGGGGSSTWATVATVWAEMRYGVKLMTPRNMVAGGAVLFVVVFVFITVRDRRNRDPAVAEALRLEKQGDVDGAVERLRAAVAEAPTAERAGARLTLRPQQRAPLGSRSPR